MDTHVLPKLQRGKGVDCCCPVFNVYTHPPHPTPPHPPPGLHDTHMLTFFAFLCSAEHGG
jgi:hypothetical protein